MTMKIEIECSNLFQNKLMLTEVFFLNKDILLMDNVIVQSSLANILFLVDGQNKIEWSSYSITK